MPSYTTYVAVDEDYKFPPEARQAMAAYTELINAFSGKGLEGTVTAHIGNGSNPHGTTKSQVGLNNVDNTSDALKPASTAQAALNAANLKLAKGRLGEVKTAASVAVSNTDLLIDFGEFNLVAGRNYKGVFRFNHDWSATGQAGVVELRKSATTDDTATGTGVAEPWVFWSAPVLSSGMATAAEFYWTATVTELVNLKAVMRRVAGTVSANVSARHLLIIDEGDQY